METITIPSPSAFLNSPAIQPAPTPAVHPPPPPRRRKSTSATTKPTTTAVSKQKPSGLAKPKQSKSRNGCITCKAKRLKCDETKPACQQCHKRNVTCGGYKKDFKWRPFEETTLTNKVAPPKTKPRSTSLSNTTSAGHGLDPEKSSKSPSLSEGSPTPSPTQEPDQAMQDSFFAAAAPSPAEPVGPSDGGFLLPNPSLQDQSIFHSPIFDANTPSFLGGQQQQQQQSNSRRIFEANSVTSSLSSLFEDNNSYVPPQLAPRRPGTSGQSPNLMDLLLPATELQGRSSLPTLSMGMRTPILDHQFPLPVDMADPIAVGEDIEEVIREPPHHGPGDPSPWLMSDSHDLHHRQHNLPHFSFESAIISPASTHDDLFSTASTPPLLYRQPEIPAGSPEMLMLRFDKHTCGILSVKDGPTENPWRTLVWPLARDSPALYHAIASMTAFHTSKARPHLRVEGMEHMRRSIRALATGIDKMRVDTALATTLVLAFSESWDQHISTGIEHLRGARILVNQALNKHGTSLIRSTNNDSGNLSRDDIQRLRFLCNTWVYMDVISRLTSVEEDESVDFELVLAPLRGFSGPALPPNASSSTPLNEIDPLMGCASTLFPLIGRVANLCRKVRHSESNSMTIISTAINLKESIESWSTSPSQFARPEDPSSDILHAIQTAEAYRYATLLFLHQAVPEIPSLSSAVLAKKVLVYLATVPLSSRLVIVQIFPLLAAGCEVTTREDREWVEERWKSMSRRMWIGNVDRCWEVIKEVWDRRDAFYAEKEETEMKRREQRPGISKKEISGDECGTKRMNSGPKSGGSGAGNSKVGVARRVEEPITEDMDPELTVRGKLHWVGVMKDWEWEILLG